MIGHCSPWQSIYFTVYVVSSVLMGRVNNWYIYEPVDCLMTRMIIRSLCLVIHHFCFFFFGMVERLRCWFYFTRRKYLRLPVDEPFVIFYFSLEEFLQYLDWKFFNEQRKWIPMLSLWCVLKWRRAVLPPVSRKVTPAHVSRTYILVLLSNELVYIHSSLQVTISRMGLAHVMNWNVHIKVWMCD